MRLPWLTLCVLPALSVSAAAAGQAPPVLRLNSVVADTVNHQLVLNYDLEDADQDSLMVRLKVSADGGKSYLLPLSEMEGDIGMVMPGAGKKIRWKYPVYMHDIGKHKIRLTAEDADPVTAKELVGQVRQDNLKRDLTAVYGVRNHHEKGGARNLTQLHALLTDRFASLNVPWEIQEFTHQKYKAKNYLVKMRGHGDETKAFVLMAHFDTVAQSAGADDNGSGVSALLEVMRILSQYHFEHSIIFLLCDLEEEGLLGSQAYVNWGIKDYERIAGGINLDMIGYYSDAPASQHIPEGFDQLYPEVHQDLSKNGFKGDFVLSVANERSVFLADAFGRNMQQHAAGMRTVHLTVADDGKLFPALRASDHASFWDRNYPCLYLGDGAFSRNPNYHSADDTVGSIHFPRMEQVVKAVLATMADLSRVKNMAVAGSDIATAAQ
jgi:hypothetical protein